MTAPELAAALEALGLPTLEVAAQRRLSAYVALRARWAAAHNLMGPAAATDPWIADVLDSLLLLPLLDPRLPLVDVGAGSGVPGLILALAAPHLRVHLVEPRAKRAAFLRTAAAEITGAQIHRARWPIDLGEPVQVAGRAVVPAPAWPALAAAGGSQVQVIFRMLARQRPPFAVEGFRRDAHREARLPNGASRCLERWRRVE